MALDLVEEIDVFTEYVHIKFGVTLKTSTIINSAFKVYVNSATPSLVTDPFVTINLFTDYNSIGKLLKLYWNAGKLLANTNYKIVMTGLKDASGAVVPDSQYLFTTGTAVNQEAANLPPAAEPVEIEDHSIRSAAFTDVTTITAANPDFYIIGTDPENFDFDLPADYNKGRIEVEFSTLPNSIFLNSNYFKVQKKLIQRSPSRWASITPHVTGDSSTNVVYLDLPSNDATPVFRTAGKTYFEKQYKYRIVVSKDVGV